MNNKNYNVFFNTHTVSGIVISVALYVIFFAGAFSLFRKEIKIWEEGNPISYTQRKDVNFDKILDSLNTKYVLQGRDVRILFGEQEDQMFTYLMGSKDSLASEKSKTPHYFYTDIHSTKTKFYNEQYSLGEFLFRLHFLQQFPQIGLYLAGLVSFFFLFAIVTGTIVHWKKIIPTFFTFNPRLILKRVWTDAHTVLGIIGLPFQFVFAVSGAYFALGMLVFFPAKFLYNNDTGKLMEDLRPVSKSYAWVAATNQPIPSFNQYAQNAAKEWNSFHLTEAYIRNYGGTNMKYVLIGEIAGDDRFVGQGRIIYDVFSGKKEAVKNPLDLNYKEDVPRAVKRLHFADFGGVSLKIVYFVLALITCFVIITGVLIWVEARNKKSVALQQRLFTAKVGHIYMAICLSLLPVTALAFLFVKFSHGHFQDKQTAIYYFYFITWLLLTIFFRLKKSNYYTNKASLLLGAIFGYLIPISNGIVSGNWFWKTFSNGQFDILFIDVLWLVIATLCLIFFVKIKPAVQKQSSFYRAPLDYNSIPDSISADKEDIEKSKTTKLRMRTKIFLLWLFIAVGFILHHIYGLASVYFNTSVAVDGANGTTPFDTHIWRILMEGLALTFGLLTLEVTKKWFVSISFAWSIILGLFNIYHIVMAVIYEASNISEILILLLLVVASVFLVKSLNQWRKNPNI